MKNLSVYDIISVVRVILPLLFFIEVVTDMDENIRLDAGICYIDPERNGILLECDEEFFHITGYCNDDVKENGITLPMLFTENNRKVAAEIMTESSMRGKAFCVRVPLLRKDGSEVFVHCTADMRDKSRVRVIVCECGCRSVVDHAHSTLLRKISEQEQKLQMIAENTNDVYYDYDIENDVMHLTVSITRYNVDYDNCIYGYMKEKMYKEFIHPDDLENVVKEFHKASTMPCKGKVEFRTMAYDDDYCWYQCAYISFADENGKVNKFFGRLSSIQNLKNLNTKVDSDSEYISYLLATDQLTGLLNRKGFNRRAESELSTRDEKSVYCLVYSDINDFSYVNENFGYEAGNKMLKDFAVCLEKGSTFVIGCRIYSDFFITLCKADTRDELIKSVEKQNVSFTELQKKRYPASDIRISCGMYVIPSTGDVEINTAIDNANLARRSVKHSSSILCGIYSQRMRMQKLYEQSICNELHAAIANRKIEMFLQPKFHLETRTIIGAEALARWRNDNGTYKMPFEFIPVLEKVGYIDELDFFIYGEVLSTLEKWKHDGLDLIPLSVNFSQHHITQPRFVENIIRTAEHYDVDNSNVEIEITESSFSGDTQMLFSVMEKLRGSGFKVSIGIGYSTLSVLMNAPVDIVKIDKSFIDNIEKNKNDRDFVATMCSLIDTAKKDVIFEGVETDAQAAILCQSGYTKAQGWLFDKAIPLADFEKKYMYKNKDNKNNA